MGGYVPAVMRRTVRDADGWYGWGLDLEETAKRFEILRETAGLVERRAGLGPLEVTITPPGDVDVATAQRYAELGVDRLNLMLPWEADESSLRRFFDSVMRPLTALR
jgi:hypothetical protein